MGPRARDVLPAVVSAVVSLAVVLPLLGPLAPSIGVQFSDPQRTWIVIVLLGQSGLLALGRRQPVLTLLGVAAGQVALATMLPAHVSLRAVPPFVAAYLAGSLLPSRSLIAAVLGSVLLEVAGGWFTRRTVGAALHTALDAGPAVMPDPLETVAAIVTVVLSTVAAAAVGAWVAMRREQLRSARERADAAVEQQRSRIESAIAAERVRMARELHDIAAHHLSGLVVQAAATEQLIDRDPAAARDNVRSLRRQGREALQNLRVAVAVLRDGPAVRAAPDDPVAPLPGLGRIDDLVAAARSAGDHVDLTVDGDDEPLPPMADTAVYRVAQEALANARRHAPGAPVRLTVARRGGGVRLEAVNGAVTGRASPGSERSAGFGLVGMRERAALLGAQLDYGPTDDGGWRVLLDVPGARGHRTGPRR